MIIFINTNIENVLVQIQRIVKSGPLVSPANHANTLASLLPTLWPPYAEGRFWHQVILANTLGQNKDNPTSLGYLCTCNKGLQPWQAGWDLHQTLPRRQKGVPLIVFMLITELLRLKQLNLTQPSVTFSFLWLLFLDNCDTLKLWNDVGQGLLTQTLFFHFDGLLLSSLSASWALPDICVGTVISKGWSFLSLLDPRSTMTSLSFNPDNCCPFQMTDF